MKVRLNIVKYITEHWNFYNPFINDYYKNLLNSQEYEGYMPQISIYGNEVEISGFCEMCNVYVEVYNNQTKNIFGKFSQSCKLVLLFSGALDSGHYDILDFSNNDINNRITLLNRNISTLEQKMVLNNNEVKIKILVDGNYLFRCFSFFLYNTKKFHMKVRLNIVKYITEHWNFYSSFIIGNNYYQNFLNSQDYESYMSKISIYSNEVEIAGFCAIYNVYVEVYNNQTKNIFGKFSQSFKLVLLFSGAIDSGHYDILDLSNNNIKAHIAQINKNKRLLKRKLILNDDEVNISNKKLNYLRRRKENVSNNKTVDEISYFGKMSYVCKFCSAVFWQEERNKSHCCHSGTVRLSPLSK